MVYDLSALIELIYLQVTLTPEQRALLHYQEVLVSNWKRELLISNVKKKIIVIHQNIFQPVPDNALKAVYFLKRYYDPFKKKVHKTMFLCDGGNIYKNDKALFCLKLLIRE